MLARSCPLSQLMRLLVPHSPRHPGNLYPLAEHRLINVGTANTKLCGMVPVGGEWRPPAGLCSHCGGSCMQAPHPRKQLSTLPPLPPCLFAVRFAHGFNPHDSRLGLPCEDELATGWVEQP